VSFTRFLRPYLIGATIVCVGAFVMGTYLAPRANKGYNEFIYEYLKKGRKDRETQDVYRQINEGDYIYVSSFTPSTQTGRNFTWEHFEGNTMTYKMSATRIKFNPKDTTYTLSGFKMREVGVNGDILHSKSKLDTVFNFDMDDLTPVQYIAETLRTKELTEFIAKEKSRGSSYIGMGVNLAFGIVLAFIFIFFDKVFGTLAEQSDFPPLIAVWTPNILFAILAVYLLQNAKR